MRFIVGSFVVGRVAAQCRRLFRRGENNRWMFVQLGRGYILIRCGGESIWLCEQARKKMRGKTVYGQPPSSIHKVGDSFGSIEALG